MSSKTRNRSKSAEKVGKKQIIQPVESASNVASPVKSAGNGALPVESASNGDSSPSKVAVPTIEQIRMRAYELFLARGGSHGDDMSDWLEAERQLQQVTAKHI